jgi:hypothetical protein
MICKTLPKDSAALKWMRSVVYLRGKKGKCRENFLAYHTFRWNSHISVFQRTGLREDKNYGNCRRFVNMALVTQPTCHTSTSVVSI